MLPRSRPSKFAVGAPSLRVVCLGLSILTYAYDCQCFGSAAYTSVAQTQSFDDTSKNSDETVVVSPRENGKVDRPTASIPEGTALNKPNTHPSLIHGGPRPLVLCTYKIATSSPTTSSPSSQSLAPRTRTIPSARWSSYHTPRRRLSQLSPSTVSDEVETLKAQLAASKALVKQLEKKKVEAVSASRRLYDDITSFQDERSKWSKEKEEFITKLGLLDEVKATPELLPPTEGVWFAGSNQEQNPPQKQPNLLSTTRISGPEHDLGVARSEVRQDAEVRPSGPAASDARSQPVASEMRDISCECRPGTSADDDALARIGSIFLYSTPQADGCDPGNTPSPASIPTASYLLTIDSLLQAQPCTYPREPTAGLVSAETRSKVLNPHSQSSNTRHSLRKHLYPPALLQHLLMRPSSLVFQAIQFSCLYLHRSVRSPAQLKLALPNQL